MLAASGQGAGAQSVQDRRRDLASLTAMVGGEAPEVAGVTDLYAPGPDGPVRLRHYRPEGAGDGAIVFLHGGGWVAGGLDTHGGVCRRLANASGQSVLAVDYGLAPERPFPGALTEVLAVTDWLAKQAAALGFDPKRLVLAGDSAGGNLAAAACLLMLERGGPMPALQVLICPILDLATPSASRLAFAEGYFLNRETLARDVADYAPAADLFDPRMSPLHAADLSGLPPTQIHVAEFDPFRDEGLAFADRLRRAGVAACHMTHPGMIHYFYAMPGALPYADRALEMIGAAVRSALAG